MNTEELRDLFENGGTPAPAVPDRSGQIARRVRRRIVRRRATAAVTGLLVAASAGLWTLQDGETAGEHPTVLATASHPEVYTAADGAVYRRIRQETMTWPEDTWKTMEIQNRGRGFAAWVSCDGPEDGSELTISHGFADPRSYSEFWGAICGINQKAPRDAFIMQEQAKDTATLNIFAKQTEFADPSKTVSPSPNRWTISLYEWTPPETVARPPAPPSMPSTAQMAPDREGRRIAVRGGTWPKNRKLTFTVPYRGRDLLYYTSCAGAIEGAATVKVLANGRPVRGFDNSNQVPPACAGDGTAMGDELPTPEKGAKTVTVELEIKTHPLYDDRAGSWSIAIYEAP